MESGSLRLTEPSMNIQVHTAEQEDVQAMREVYLRDSNCQMI